MSGIDALPLLILGGTGDGLALAQALTADPRWRPVYSVAGRTRAPRLPDGVESRVGGFGGVDGLIAELRARGIRLLVDATHPFAVQMSAHAAEAARATGLPLLSVRRPPWTPQPGDRWTEVADMASAVDALGQQPKCVFLTIGQKDLTPVARAPHHRYVLRSVDPPPSDLLPPGCLCITARGPFTETDERTLMTTHGVDVVVTKNSGGSATIAKLTVARALGLPVILVARPPLAPEVTAVVETPEQALHWLDQAHAAVSSASPSGVAVSATPDVPAGTDRGV